ncbi:MAG: hypothetical protein E7480_03055 [Ruminococcaceae bacterium]|nr:hypothetical protein [Oscillospiraceae bacterium]
MKIKFLNLTSFGKFSNKKIELSDGLNIVYGKNEAGKTTFFSFIRFMLYGLSKTKGNLSIPEYKQYIPWDKETVEGSMDFETDGRILRISKSQKKTSVQATLTNAATADPINDINAKEIGKDVFGVNVDTFTSTAFIRQNDLEIGSNAELEGKLNNLAFGGDEKTSYNDAKSKIDKALTKLTRPSGLIANKRNEIIKLNDELIASKELISSQNELNDNVNNIQKECYEIENKIKELEKIYNALQANDALKKLENIQSVENELKEYTDRLNAVEKSLNNIDENQLENIKALVSQLSIYEQRIEFCKLQLSQNKHQLEIKEKQTESYSIIDGKENQINSSIKSAEKTKNIPLIVITLLAFLVGVGTFIAGIIINLIACIVVGVLLTVSTFILLAFLIIGDTKASKLNKIAKSYGCIDYNQLILKISQLESLKKEIDFYKSEAERYLTQKNNEEQSREKLLQQIKDSGLFENQEINEINLKAFCTQTEELLTRRKICQQNVLNVQNNLNMLTDGIDIGELKNLSLQKESLNGEFSAQKVFEELKEKRELLQAKIQIMAELKNQCQSIFIGHRMPDEISGDIYVQSEKLKKLENQREILSAVGIALDKAYQKISLVFAPQMCQKASEYFNKISNGNRELLINSKNEIIIRENDFEREFDFFSTGTKDAAYISARIAVCQLIYGQNKPPIIIDDAFAHFDNERMKQAVLLLKEICSEEQIILFTCRQEQVKCCEEFANIINL